MVSTVGELVKKLEEYDSDTQVRVDADGVELLPYMKYIEDEDKLVL